MVDRRLVFGDPADAGTRWAMDDAAGAAGGGNFVIARDLDGAGVLLRYNPTSGNFEYFGDVDLGGRSIQNGATTVFDGATDTVGDGTTSANHESVKTESQALNPKLGSDESRIVFDARDGIFGYEQMDDNTTSVGTTATTILDPETLGGDYYFGARVLIHGQDGVGGSRFIEELLVSFGNSVTVLGSETRRSPASRSYSTAFNPGRLELAMGSDSYDVTVTSTVFD
jgi:hypothetical protein